MYKPLGDRILVTVKRLDDYTMNEAGIYIPPAHTTDDRPNELLKVIAKGEGSGCDLLNIGDMVITSPNAQIYMVFETKENNIKYFITGAGNVICRAYKSGEESPIDMPTNKDLN